MSETWQPFLFFVKNRECSVTVTGVGSLEKEHSRGNSLNTGRCFETVASLGMRYST